MAMKALILVLVISLVSLSVKSADNTLSTPESMVGEGGDDVEEIGPGPPLADIQKEMYHYDNVTKETTVTCAPGQELTWYNMTWKAGYIRKYYVPKGKMNSVADCINACSKVDDCYFATFTGKKNCYFLNTTSSVLCKYMTKGHFPPNYEPCTKAKPCPSGYKICGNPKCSLIVLATLNCLGIEPKTALTTCSAFGI